MWKAYLAAPEANQWKLYLENPKSKDLAAMEAARYLFKALSTPSASPGAQAMSRVLDTLKNTGRFREGGKRVL